MRHEWKKHEKELYKIKNEPSILVVPRQNYIMITGKGNPNDAEFTERVGVLCSLAYPIKMQYKAFCKNSPEQSKSNGTAVPQIKGFEYDDYTVFPLEGIWTSTNADNPLDKDSFVYTIMIRQPDFITMEMFQVVYAAVVEKKPHPFLKEVMFDTIEDGLCVQILHNGPFDDEPESFAKMDKFAKENGFLRISHIHREIYLTDFRKTMPKNFKTILRYQVKRNCANEENN